MTQPLADQEKGRQMKGVTGTFLSRRTVADKSRRAVMHPNDALDLIAALQWATEESDRLAGMANQAGLYITKVELRMPSSERHSVEVILTADEPTDPA